MTESQKKWIDNASYEQLLSRWRFAPIGDPMFRGDAGDYYKSVMKAKREEDPNIHTTTSKKIGWDK